MTTQPVSLSPWKMAKQVTKGNVARVAVVNERDSSGSFVTRCLEVQDVEERKPDAKEIIVVDPITEEKILRGMRRYNSTLLYIAVIITAMLVVSIINAFFS